MRKLVFLLAACGGAGGSPKPAAAPSVPAVTPTASLVAPMAKLAFMRGVWVGPATGVGQDGKPYKVTQTERMGPMLGGDIIVIEGRGYEADGTTGFNAFAVASFDQQTQKYELRSYTQGMAGTFELTPNPDGYVWEIPAGPDAVIRFTATVTADHWREVGEYVANGAAPVQTFEMNLQKVGDTDWPLDTPISPDATPRAAAPPSAH
jgi:hypothetical protein